MYRCTYSWDTMKKLSASICHENFEWLPSKCSRQLQLTRDNISIVLKSLIQSVGSNRSTYILGTIGHQEKNMCTCHEMFISEFKLTLLGLQSRFGDNWWKITCNLSGLSPKRDWSSKGVNDCQKQCITPMGTPADSRQRQCYSLLLPMLLLLLLLLLIASILLLPLLLLLLL